LTSGGIASPTAGKMDGIYRFQRVIYNPTRRFFLLGRTTLLERLDAPDGGRVLEVGCGTAWNLVRAARLYPEARFAGLDVSQVMLHTAHRCVVRNHLSDRIDLRPGDATSFDAKVLFGIPSFDRILVSYTLSMIPDWQAVLHCAVQSLSADGSIHIIDFGPCHGLPALFRRVLYGWLSRFSVCPVKSLQRELARFTKEHDLKLSFIHLYGGYATYAVLRRT